LENFAFTTHDAGGRRSTLQVPLYRAKGEWNYLTTTYGFDTANRLTTLLHQNPAGTIENFAWSYDPNGNRESVSQSATIPLATPVGSSSYDRANEQLALDGATLGYDENGNLETRTDACGTTSYTWDGRNRLTGISGYKPDCSALNASFGYDALNRRTERTVNGVTTEYVYDGWDILRESTAGVTTDYTRTLNIDEPLALERSDGTIRYYKADALGSIIALTDENGVVTTSYAYDAFGNVTVSGNDFNAFQYTGRENDETGLYYYRARYYSPGLRRFISQDPIRLAGGINFFAYVRNNPIHFIDPFGLNGWGDVVDIGSSIFDTSGTGAFVGSIVGSGIGGGFGGYFFGPPGAAFGYLVGNTIGGELGGLIDGPNSGQPNYNEQNYFYPPVPYPSNAKTAPCFDDFDGQPSYHRLR